MATDLTEETHPNLDLFITNGLIRIGAGKLSLDMLEHPMFSLQSRGRDMNTFRYESNDGMTTLEIRPSAKGRATMRDSDFIRFMMAKLVAMKDEGLLESDNVYIDVETSDFLDWACRGDGGRSYEAVRDMLDRLAGTFLTIENQRVADNKADIVNTSFIDNEWKATRETKNNLLLAFQVKPKPWLVRQIRESNRYLTISRLFFRIKLDLDRKFYDMARKHVTGTFKISWELWHNKSGSYQKFPQFRSRIRKRMKEGGGSFNVLEYEFSESEDKRHLVIKHVPTQEYLPSDK